MRHFIFSAVVLAGVLATANSVSADPVAAMASDLAQVAAPAASPNPRVLAGAGCSSTGECPGLARPLPDLAGAK